MKCVRYFSFALFVLLGVFFGSFIINQNNTYAATWTSSDLVSTYNIEFSTNYRFSQLGFDLSFVPKYFKFIYSLDEVDQDGFITLRFNSSTFAAVATGFDVPLNARNIEPNPSEIIFGSPGYTTPDPYIKFSSTNYNSHHPILSSFIIVASDEPLVFGISPDSSLSISQNGTYDVTNYAEAVVNVPNSETIIYGDYHDDLVAINNSILICAAVCLVIYFFYCIYRMIIKSTGGWR